ncbi:unnamed protein product [Lathyrus sativus]|nr:unnamed protein product [Lathyrus sativus]
MASSKSFILALLIVATMSSMKVEGRRLLQTTTLSNPATPSLPKSSLLDSRDLSVTPSLPKGSLPPLDTSIPSLSKHTMPPFPNFPSTDPSFSIPPVSSPAPTPVSTTPKPASSFFSFPFFSQTLSIFKP